MLANSSSERKIFLQNAQSLVKVAHSCKDLKNPEKGIIFGSETDSSLFMRSPLDIIQIGRLLGMQAENARKAISSNCLESL